MRYKQFYFLIILMSFLACKTPPYFYCDTVTIRRDSIITYSNCINYYNPLSRNRDSLLIAKGEKINDHEILSPEKIIVVKAVKNGRGYYKVYRETDSVLFVDCTINKNKIDGKVIKYYSPLGKDIALVAQFSKNKLHGLTYQIYPDGDTIQILLYRKGKLIKKYLE